MQHLFYRILLSISLALGVHGFGFSQGLSDPPLDGIKSEIFRCFAESIKAGENLDLAGVSASIDDSLKTGFIDNGQYFSSFDELMVGYKAGIQGLDYQRMNVITKKITVLSRNSALLTAHGDFTAKITDGRMLKGEFAWTFIYRKIDGNWKVIHSHMSNPRS